MSQTGALQPLFVERSAAVCGRHRVASCNLVVDTVKVSEEAAARLVSEGCVPIGILGVLASRLTAAQGRPGA
jgi:hypothetical protein